MEYLSCRSGSVWGLEILKCRRPIEVDHESGRLFAFLGATPEPRAHVYEAGAFCMGAQDSKGLFIDGILHWIFEGVQNLLMVNSR